MLSYILRFVKIKILERSVIYLASDLELFDNKIIILYILEKNSKALSIEQIAKFCEDFDDITYFDICSYIQELKSNNYIEENYTDSNGFLYNITSSGLSTLQELLELIPGVNLHNIKKIINNIDKYEENNFGTYSIKEENGKNYTTYNTNTELQELLTSLGITLEKCLKSQ